LVVIAGFFLGAGFFSAFRATTGRAAFLRDALRVARFLTGFLVLAAVEPTRLRAAGRALFVVRRTAFLVVRRTPFAGPAAFRRAFFCAAFFATLRTGRARRSRAGLVAFRAVARALLRLAIA